VSSKVTVSVHGMTCGGCENAVKRAVSALPGIVEVSASHKDNQVVVTFDPALTSQTVIEGRIDALGYRVGA
jgi:copper chaperone CopZ